MISEWVKESWERFPENTRLHQAMRETWVQRMSWQHFHKTKQTMRTEIFMRMPKNLSAKTKARLLAYLEENNVDALKKRIMELEKKLALKPSDAPLFNQQPTNSITREDVVEIVNDTLSNYFKNIVTPSRTNL